MAILGSWRAQAGLLAAMVSAAALSAPATTLAQPAAARTTLRQLVTPASRLEVQGRVVRFALHGLVEFETLSALFAHIDAEAGRWRFPTDAARQAFADDLARRGIESRVVSMETELPLDLLLTHTRAELDATVTAVTGGDDAPVFDGRHWRLTGRTYREAFGRVRDRWSTSLNCWSASSSLPGRVLSNWYVIDEGIRLYGADYDSTEHFWQAVKYHPDVTIDDLRVLLTAMRPVDWATWLDTLASDQTFYLAHTYAVEFLKRNLRAERLDWYRDSLAPLAADVRARAAQQKGSRASGAPLAYTPVQEKILWGDLADVLHLIVTFSAPGAPATPAGVRAIRDALVARHFDAIVLDGYAGGRVGFLSPEFQALMLEIWKVKYLQMPRLREVIRSTTGTRLDHFLNDGDSPDIPIPIYVGYLNRIRELALEAPR